MFDKIKKYLSKLFKINSNLYLPQASFEEVSNNNYYVSPISIAKFENLNSESKSNNSTEKHGNDEECILDEDEYVFEYDIRRAEEMNKKIDYYKKHVEELYIIPLEEIEEINFYYKKRIEKLENKIKVHRS